jgi:hypothetical protein
VTKLRTPLSFEAALAQVAGEIGWPRSARICGYAESTVRNWSDPDTTAAISIESALRLDAAFIAAGGDSAPFFACYAARLKQEAEAVFSADKLLRCGAAAAKESGEAISAIFDAARPGAGRHEREQAAREVEESILQHQQVLATLRGPEVPHAGPGPDTS